MDTKVSPPAEVTVGPEETVVEEEEVTVVSPEAEVTVGPDTVDEVTVVSPLGT